MRYAGRCRVEAGLYYLLPNWRLDFVQPDNAMADLSGTDPACHLLLLILFCEKLAARSCSACSDYGDPPVVQEVPTEN